MSIFEGTVACECALKYVGTLLSRDQALPSAPRPDGGLESLRSSCCGLAIHKKQPTLSIFSPQNVAKLHKYKPPIFGDVSMIAKNTQLLKPSDNLLVQSDPIMESKFDLNTASSSPDFFQLIFLITDTANSSPNHTTPMFISERQRLEYLRRLQEQTTLAMIPSMVFILLIALVGLIGNSLVIYVYSQNLQLNASRFFICVIAVFDLVSNVLLIPGEVYDMFNVWDFDHPILCQIRLGLNAVITIMSASTLIALAFVRYRKVCAPFEWQVTIRQAKFISFILLLVSAVFAAPFGIIKGRKTRKAPHPGIYGSECTTDDAYVDTIWPLVVSVFFFVLFSLTTMVMIVLYSLVGVKAWRHSQSSPGVTSAGAGSSSSESGGVTHSSSGPTGKSGENSQEENGVEDSTNDTKGTNKKHASKDESLRSVKTPTLCGIVVISDIRPPEQEEAKRNETGKNVGSRNSSGSKVNENKSTETKVTVKPKHSLNRATLMCFIISAVYIITFLPFVLLTTVASVKSEEISTLEGPPLALYNFFLRSFFINCAANAIIYYICDLAFRRECIKLFCKLFCFFKK
ncbi:cephalotocin receptor 1 [Plakobranchus ocellatus]|uniref:Cephalotocin receptor 1 n=1 Tax=Plakobranchus ocellatus TaxID=259542 RepID=A0AAV3XY26_9GAST|nr:cephalotocin receptor 1 [Plakobranchus ocellatus]